jgi:predicted DNA-binding protein
MAEKGKTLQARVPAEYARRFATVAAARGISESALVREATDKILAEAEDDIDGLKARVRARLKAREEQELADIDAAFTTPADEPADEQAAEKARAAAGTSNQVGRSGQ